MRRIVQRAILLSLLLGSGRSVGVRKAQSMREASRAWPSKQDFLERLRSTTGDAVMLDVGANDGARVVRRLSAASPTFRQSQA